MIVLRGPFGEGNLRHGVISRSTPRIASQYPPNGKGKPFDGPILEESLAGVL